MSDATRQPKSLLSDPAAPAIARDCADHSQSVPSARASSSSGARALSIDQDKAIERAKSAFMCARTAYGRKRAMRTLQELGVTIGGKK